MEAAQFPVSRQLGIYPAWGPRAARRLSLYNGAVAVLVSSGASKLADTRHFGRLAGTAIVVLGVAGAFLYLGGWFNPEALTPARFADGFERVDGIYSGFRLNHAKGVCVSGSFESNGQGTRLSKAVVFKAGRVPIIGRFSLAGGNPYVADEPEMVRGLGLLFKLPDGEEWRTAMINTPVFGVNTPQAFYDRLLAAQPDPKTGKPDPEKMAAFLASHPETVQATKIIQSHPASSGFENSTLLRSECLLVHGRERKIDTRPLVVGASAAVCTREYDRTCPTRQKLSVRCVDRGHPSAAAAVAPDHHDWPGKRSDQRCHHPLARRARTGGCRDPDARSRRERGNQPLPRH